MITAMAMMLERMMVFKEGARMCVDGYCKVVTIARGVKVFLVKAGLMMIYY